MTMIKLIFALIFLLFIFFFMIAIGTEKYLKKRKEKGLIQQNVNVMLEYVTRVPLRGDIREFMKHIGEFGDNPHQERFKNAQRDYFIYEEDLDQCDFTVAFDKKDTNYPYIEAIHICTYHFLIQTIQFDFTNIKHKSDWLSEAQTFKIYKAKWQQVIKKSSLPRSTTINVKVWGTIKLINNDVIYQQKNDERKKISHT